MQNTLTNPTIKAHAFLEDMYADDYFPNVLVDKGKLLLIGLCLQIEQQKPASADEVYKLTHAVTEQFNELAAEFEHSGSEIETAAREAIAADVEAILNAYGFGHLDLEEAIAPRDW